MKRQTLTFLATLLLAGAVQAAPVVINTDVESTDNLFFSDWGHWWTGVEDEALGEGTPASAVNWAFNGGDSLHITASGWVVDDGPFSTNPAGQYLPDAACQPDCTFQDGFFRNLPVYSLIGVWSTSPDAIIPITENPLTLTAPFFIGLEAWLTVPQGFGELYLFLANNDGYFADNSGSYQVSIALTPIPRPAAAWFMLSALASLLGWRRLSRRTA